MIYQKGYDALLKICKQITTHRQKIAKPKIEELIYKHIDIHISNEDLLSHLISESLLKRIDRQLLESKNIYIQHFDIPQITLFYSMAKAIPFVSAGHHAANQYLAEVMGNLEAASLFEIGIGKGLQVKNLLNLLKERKNKLETVNIIALDPDKRNLEESKVLLDHIQKELHFTLHYYSFHKMIEEFTDRDYEYIKEIGKDTVVINSAFTLHHTSHPINDHECRTNLLKKLAQLKPLVFTLVEPNSNHDVEDLSKRFHHSWEHFGKVFKLIDESNIDESHKFSIKENFFGREIRDIFGVSDYFRTERHELYDSWLLRLSRAGFKPIDYHDIKVELPEYCSYSISDGLIRMNYDNTTVVAVFGYTL